MNINTSIPILMDFFVLYDGKNGDGNFLTAATLLQKILILCICLSHDIYEEDLAVLLSYTYSRK